MEQPNSTGKLSAACFNGLHLSCDGASCVCVCDCAASATVSRWLATLSPAELDQERRAAAIALASYFRLAGYGHPRLAQAVA